MILLYIQGLTKHARGSLSPPSRPYMERQDSGARARRAFMQIQGISIRPGTDVLEMTKWAHLSPETYIYNGTLCKKSKVKTRYASQNKGMGYGASQNIGLKFWSGINTSGY